jgi:PII-like signaling protein
MYEALARTCQTFGIADVTVFHGMKGYGESAEIHHHRLPANDQPTVMTIVGSAENIDRLIPEIEKMVDTAMNAVSDADTIRIPQGRVRRPPTIGYKLLHFRLNL